jgi:putative redox protein
MEVKVNLLDDKMLEANFNGFKLSSGPGHPEAYDYFSASTALCAGFYVNAFCEARKIPTKGIEIVQNEERINDDKLNRAVSIVIKLPEDFPAKYKKAVLTAAEQCTVKKVIQNGLEFSLTTS